MAERTSEGGGVPPPTAAAGASPDDPAPRNPLQEASAALISILHADDISAEASVEPMRIDPAGQKKIFAIFAPEEGRALFPTAAGQERARKDAWLALTAGEWEALFICISRALEIHEALKSAASSEAVRIALPRLIDLLAKEHLDHLRRRLNASPTPAAAAAPAAEEETDQAPVSATELFSVDKLTGNSSSLQLLNAALASPSWVHVENFFAAVKDNDVAAEHLFDAIWISLDNVLATEDQLVIVNTLLATWEGSTVSSEEKRNATLMAARKVVGAACLSVAKAMISKSIRGYSEFLGNMHFDESIRRVWEQEPAALMVMKLQSPDGILQVLSDELHLFHPLQQFASTSANKLGASTAADVVIKCLMGFAAFAYGTLSIRLGDDFDANVCRLINAISLYNENCRIMPGGAMGIVLTIIVPAIKIRFTDVFKRRRALSFLQDSVSSLPGPISKCLTLITLPPEVKFHYEMTVQRLNFLVTGGANTWSMTGKEFWGDSPQGALFGYGAGQAAADDGVHALNDAGAAGEGSGGRSRKKKKGRTCNHWAKHGTCRFGDKCIYSGSHTKEAKEAALARQDTVEKSAGEKDPDRHRSGRQGGRGRSPPAQSRKSPSRSRSRSRSKSPVARGEATLTQRRLQGGHTPLFLPIPILYYYYNII
jgi:hypothetical protein